MENWEIIYLDCSKKENRKKLLKEAMKAVKSDEKPTKEYLEKFSYSVGKKYKMGVQLVKQVKGKLFVSIRYEDSYITIMCDSYYEALCKHILIVKQMRKLKEQKVR